MGNDVLPERLIQLDMELILLVRSEPVDRLLAVEKIRLDLCQHWGLNLIVLPAFLENC